MEIKGKLDDRDVKIMAMEKLSRSEHFVVITLDRANQCTVLYSDKISDVRPLVRRGLLLFNRQHPITLRKKRKKK